MSSENKEITGEDMDSKEMAANKPQKTDSEHKESAKGKKESAASDKKEAGRIKKSFQTRRFKAGAYSSVVTVLVVALVIVLNLVVNKLNLSTDLSKGNLFTLSKETKKVLKENKKDITLYYMVSDGSEFEYIENVLKEYTKQSKYISMEKIDPIVNPAFASRYDIKEDVGTNDCLVVLNETKSAKLVSASEMYYSEQASYSGSGSNYLDVEGQITSAIQTVLSGNTTKMYIVSGHSEVPVADAMTKAFDKMNVETENLELLTSEKIPEDCDILMMNGPATDITENEKNVLLDYLQAGGNAVINMEYTTEKTPNLQEVLEYYGIRSTQGVICEISGKYYYYPNYVVPEIGNDGYDILADVQGYSIMPNAIGLNIMSEIRSSLKMQELLTTSDSSYLKTDPSSGSSEKESGDVDGPFSVGICATENVEDDAQTKLIVYASSATFDESYVETNQLENGTLLKAAVSSMITEETEKVAIDAKSLDYSYLNITPAMQLVWAAVLVILIPLTCLIVGFVIWLMRRKR